MIAFTRDYYFDLLLQGLFSEIDLGGRFWVFFFVWEGVENCYWVCFIQKVKVDLSNFVVVFFLVDIFCLAFEVLIDGVACIWF